MVYDCNALDRCLIECEEAVGRILFFMRAGDELNATILFYKMLEQMSDTLREAGYVELAQRDLEDIESHSQIFYAPAVITAIGVYQKCAAAEKTSHGQQRYLDVPIDVNKLKLYGKSHLHLDPFKSNIDRLLASFHSRG